MFARNRLSKAAQFSFAADLFMLQAILRSEGDDDSPDVLEYVFPCSCYRQVIDWLLTDGEPIGLKPFEGVITKRDATEVRITFPSPAEEDRMHRFFAMFNRKRQEAQGVDPSFPPVPDVYQGMSKPIEHVTKRYMVKIEMAFDGEADVVPVPVGPSGAEFEFQCS
jgi:hypothetical protein